MRLIQPRLVLILFFLTIWTMRSSAQESFHKLSLGTGWAGSTLKDKVISSYIYKKNGIPILLEYNYKGYHSFMGVRVYMLFNKLKTDENKGFAYKGDLGNFVPDKINGLTHSQVSCFTFQTRGYVLGRIYMDDRLSLGIGGFVQYDHVHKRFLVLSYENKLKEGFFSIGPQLMPVYISGPHEFQFALSASLLTVGARKLAPDEGSTTRVSGTSFLKEYMGVESRLTYSYSISQTIGVDFNYIFYYYQYSKPRKEQMAIQNLTAGLSFMF